MDVTRLRWEGQFPHWQRITKDWNEGWLRQVLWKFHCLRQCLVACNDWLPFVLLGEVIPDNQPLAFLPDHPDQNCAVTILQRVYRLYAIGLCKWHRHQIIPFLNSRPPTLESNCNLNIHPHTFPRKLGEMFRWWILNMLNKVYYFRSF